MNILPRSLQLLCLPDELLRQILSFLTSHSDLSAVCLVNRHLNSIADPQLHKSILFGEPQHHLTFTESLATRPRRGSLIQNIRVEYPSSELSEFLGSQDGHGYRIDRFSHSISAMTNLEHLVVSVPEALLHGIGHVFNGPFDLACLKSCSLFYQREDDSYWDLRENIHVFSHPSLEHLIIRRAKLDHRGFESLEKPWKTALQTLQLLECDIHDDALNDLLILPEALKEITITQLETPEPALEEAPELVDDYVLAMRSTVHSLECITIDFPTLGSGKPMRLREFDRLTRLQLRDFQLFGQASPRLVSVGLPPNLETLRFFNQVGSEEDLTDLLCYTIENKEMLARKWTKMIVEGAGHPPPDIIKACQRFDGFLVETQRSRRRLVSTDSVIMEISSPVTDRAEGSGWFGGRGEVTTSPVEQCGDEIWFGRLKNACREPSSATGVERMTLQQPTSNSDTKAIESKSSSSKSFCRRNTDSQSSKTSRSLGKIAGRNSTGCQIPEMEKMNSWHTRELEESFGEASGQSQVAVEAFRARSVRCQPTHIRKTQE